MVARFGFGEGRTGAPAPAASEFADADLLDRSPVGVTLSDGPEPLVFDSVEAVAAGRVTGRVEATSNPVACPAERSALRGEGTFEPAPG